MKTIYQKTADSLLPKLDRCIKIHLNDENFGVKQLAIEMGMSQSNLYRKLKQSTGKNISRYICEIRLEKAHEILSNTEFNTSEVAFKVGFSSVSYFSKCFSQHYGYSPSRVRFQHDDGALNQKDQKRKPWLNSSGKTEGVVMTLKEALSSFFIRGSSRSLRRKRITVCPFKNLNIDEDYQYLTISLVQAIRRHLSYCEHIDVIYNELKDGATPIQELGKMLKVTHILQGSLQKVENIHRIEVRLIEAQTRNHVWCNKYDIPILNSLKIQTSTAKNIVKALQVNLVIKDEIDHNKQG